MEIVLAFVLAAAGIFAAWYFWWKPPPHQSSKPDQFDVPIWNRVGEWSYMPLHEAARILYEKIRHTTLAAAAEWDSSPDGILDWCGVWIAKTKKTPLYGRRPPATALERIPSKEVNSMNILKGARVLESQYHEDSRYVELKIRKRDFRRILKETISEADGLRTNGRGAI